MTPTALLVVALGFAPPPPQQQPGRDRFATRQAQGIVLHYGMDLAPQDVDAMLATLVMTRDALRTGLGVALPVDPVVQLRERRGARKAYYTDGQDRIFFDFPSRDRFARLQQGDERVLRYSIPCFLQLWLYRSLSSTAGLDARVLDSLVEYTRYLIEAEKARSARQGPPPPPSGPGQAWFQLDSIYPGTTTFVLNTLSSQKVPAHALGKALREIAVGATEDPAVARLFDLIAPPEPILMVEDLAPGKLVEPTLPLRPGRLALFNGTPLLDTESEPISETDRINDFDTAFDMVAMTLPAATVLPDPPTVRGIPLWPIYFEFRPRILKARDNLDYFVVLREFLGRFADRAVSLRPTPALPVPPGSPLWASVFGLGFERVRDRIYVATVTPDTEPAKAGLEPGLEVVRVDGRPAGLVHELLVEAVQGLDSCPSRQRAEAMALRVLLSGAQGTECELELLDPAASGGGKDAGRRVVRFTRGLPPLKPVPATVEHELRAADQVGVIKVHQFLGDALQRFAAALDDFGRQGAKALVIDLRGNEGVRDPRSQGSIALAMLARLLPPGSGKLVVGSSVHRDRNRFETPVPTEIVVSPAPAATSFTGPIAVLTDAWTGGEAEVFVLGFQLCKRGLVVGGTTGGSVTTPMEAKPFQSLVRSRLELSFAVSEVVRPDNGAVQSVGIPPHVEVEADLAELKARRDAVLEVAAKRLLESVPRDSPAPSPTSAAPRSGE
jgi:C-terminal processing protease CtpA/Prc